MSSSGVESLSGVHFNAAKNQLFLVQDLGRLRIIQLNSNGNHLQLTDRNLGGDLEGITQIDEQKNEFWVLDENNLSIKKYQYNNNFSSVNVARTWDLSLPQSGMIASTDGGPEGICFVPDQALSDANFISSLSGLPYQSQKGMGGLVFIAHQINGEIWVFDINENVNNDYVLVGRYLTNRNESCGLEFDRSTGLLYILHNIDNNFMEVTDLSATQINGQYKLNALYEFNITIPTNGGKNIEGIALAPKCENLDNQRLWLARDVTGTNANSALKEFAPISLVGDCENSSSLVQDNQNLRLVYPNPVENELNIVRPFEYIEAYEIWDISGRKIQFGILESKEVALRVEDLEQGVYLLIMGGIAIKFQKR